MSLENHPNINAAGFTVAIIKAFRDNLRGKAAENLLASIEVVKGENAERLVDFVAILSEDLDKKFGD